MAAKRDIKLEIKMEGLEFLDNHILHEELSIVHRMLTHIYSDALKDQNSEIIELCESIGIKKSF